MIVVRNEVSISFADRQVSDTGFVCVVAVRVEVADPNGRAKIFCLNVLVRVPLVLIRERSPSPCGDRAPPALPLEASNPRP